MSHDTGQRPTSTWHRKAAMIVPLLMFFILAAVIDTSPVRDGETVHASAYFISVVARVVAMSAAILWFGREIVRQFPLAIDCWGWIVGVVGAALWIGVCALDLERQIIDWFALPDDWLPKRDGVNPFATYPSGAELASFLLMRFTLLAVCVPIAEELFLRGFVMRAFEAEDWPSLPLTEIGRNGLIIGTVYGIATHPAECFAAALWFSLVSWLMVKTGKFWNCVIAHGVTNLILGIYVCLTGTWHLW
ncbi:CPBP family glutamic-type intramembrane protease [Stieleria maiorica]|uniref:CPBP family glutamic-type intramembrane protease n=1 Tax=Stieleria maiorica TaxID=2795974 RepID=UPI0011C7ABA0|nr:CPBP family glutamic-type intramembrane protease [Stieleria maiorica]